MILKSYKIGLSEDDDALTKLRVILANLIILFSVPLYLLYLPFFLQADQKQSLYLFCLAILSLTVCYGLNYKRQFKLASALILITSNLLIFFTIINYGKSSESQVILPILMIFVFVFFDKIYELIFLGALNILTFVVSYRYIDIVNPEFLTRMFPGDYYLNMGFAILSCAILSCIVMATLNSYISRQETAIKELEIKNKLIAKQNEDMELFTSMASHDLKTPTRTITSFLGLLDKSGDVKSPHSNEYLRLAISGANQLNNLIDGISVFKNLDKSEIPTNYKRTDHILSEVLRAMDIESTSNININRSQLPDLKIMSTQLFHIFQNLLENAIKYNISEIKQIDFDSAINNGHVYMTVSDNGIGIEKEYLDYIFEPFKKLHSTDKYESTGLGLSICKKILEFYDATISAESNGSGTKIILMFPSSLLNTKLLEAMN